MCSRLVYSPIHILHSIKKQLNPFQKKPVKSAPCGKMLDGGNEVTPLFVLHNCGFHVLHHHTIPTTLNVYSTSVISCVSTFIVLFMIISPPSQVPKSAVTNPDDLELWLKVIMQIYGEPIYCFWK
jgi:hypothetical protein